MRRSGFGLCLAGLAVSLGSAPAMAGLLGHRHATVAHTTTRIGDWRLDVARNAFSGAVACRLIARNGRAVFMADAVGFRFRRGWDVAGAIYRLDGRAPRSSRDDVPELMALGAPIDRGGMDNASGGLVWIPYARLAEANSVAIEPRPDRAPIVFHFRGLKGLHDIAVARGCTPASRFVER